MPVPAEGLQTQGRRFIVEEKGCLTLNAYDRWYEQYIGKVSDGVACPITL